MWWLARIWRNLRDRPHAAAGDRCAGDACASGAVRRGESTQARLRRLAHWCVTGNIAGAELELHDWLRDGDCPPTALKLLASLLARRGRTDWAVEVLRQRHRIGAGDDLGVGRLLVAVLGSAQMPEAARLAALEVHHYHGHDPGVVDWLEAMEAASAYPLPATSAATVERLEAELTARPLVVPSLVAAARITPDLPNIQLLRQALSRAIEHFEDQPQMLSFCQALAELALLANDMGDARRWANRGLTIQPYSAALALVLAETGDDPAAVPATTHVLQRAVAAHPTYPDLRAALEARQREAA